MGVLLSDYAHPQKLPWPTLNRHPRPRPDPKTLPAIETNPQPRATFRIEFALVELWCIPDLQHLPDTSNYQSSTERKAERLSLVVSAGIPDLTIAVGTAARGT